jgi:hypothetical protein
MRVRAHVLALGFGLAIAALVVDTPQAQACGCLSPPAVQEGEYAVNQRAEQIIFEVEPGWVTAHVLIKYAGDPAKFAWIVPVPEVPELAISPLTAFGLLDRATSPAVTVRQENICPIAEYACVHAADNCRIDDSAGNFADAGALSDAPGQGGPVDVISEQIVGDYQTVIFRASEAQAATQWLRSNGFIVNNTTSIYMEPYVQANMVFVAAKLVPGAGASSIKPLRMKYRAPYPQVPLVLTAVAAEPHLTVTSFVYAQKPFKPQGHPVVQISSERIAQDAAGRTNYPMVMARTVDEAGGDGFVIEYRGTAVKPEFGNMNGFCCGETDSCGLGNNSLCECPRSPFDKADCDKTSDIVDGVKLLDDLAAKYTAVTRLTTRVSAEEMTFDPAFEADFQSTLTGRLAISASQPTLAACESDVIDKARFAEATAMQGCSTVYCGAGQCMTTAQGAGCACDAGYVAQRFTDLDGLPSVTCVPQTPPCDLRAGGDVLPDACRNADCGAGVCMDRNGVGVCACNAGAAAVTAGSSDTPRCEAIVRSSESPGAQDFSESLRDLDVCAPEPPSCGADGWLVRQESKRPGVACHASKPTPDQMIPKLGKSCDGLGCGCAANDGAPIGGLVGGAWLFMALVVRRRRSR